MRTGYCVGPATFMKGVRDYLKERQERKLEALILEGINSGEPTPFKKSDFEAIRERGIRRIKQRLQK